MKNKNKYQQKHIVKLSAQEKQELLAMVKSGKHNSREINRARVLLKSSEGMKDKDISVHVGIAVRSIERIRSRYDEGGVNKAIYDDARSGQPLKITPQIEGRLVAIACSSPPEGQSVWTLELLQKKLIKDNIIKNISTVAIWHHLKNRGIKPWREKNVVHSQRNV